MLHNKLLRVVQAHLLGFSTGIMFSGNAWVPEGSMQFRLWIPLFC